MEKVARVGSRVQASTLYMIKGVIGSGGMGTVYRAVDVQLGREVAVKVLRSPDPELLERFLREREITADLDHPSFVRVLSVGYIDRPDGSYPFYAMPLIRGLTLDQLVRARGEAGDEGDRLRSEYTLPRLLQVLQQICLTMQSAHDKQIVHRDLKPSNIIVGPYGDVYVVDLGLAKLQGSSPDTRRLVMHLSNLMSSHGDLTTEGALGTPYYMAPEQVLSPRTVGPRADIFGLGGILYFILTGRRPHYVEPSPSRVQLENRQREIADELRRHCVTPGTHRTTVHLPPQARALLQEYRELSPVLEEYRRNWLRLVMEQCRIIPPGELLRQEPDSSCEPVDPALEAICMKALARDPLRRHDSCRDLSRELQQYLEGRRALILQRSGHLYPGAAAPLDFEKAERKLQEAIDEQERLGRVGIEDRIELFDVLLAKARCLDRNGNDEAVVRTLTRAEPIIESTLAVLERQFIQVLIVKGSALHRQGRLRDAGSMLQRAADFAAERDHPDLRLTALQQLGCTRMRQFLASADREHFEAGCRALRAAVPLADAGGTPSDRARARASLGRLLAEGGVFDEAWTLLEEADSLAPSDDGSLAEILLARAAWHLHRGAWDDATDCARRAGARPGPGSFIAQEADLLLGQALHGAGDAKGRVESLRRISRHGTGRDPTLVDELDRFYSRNGLDLAELEDS